MNTFRKLLLLTLFLLAGCSSQPTVYVYGKYLNQSQKDHLVKQFEKDAYFVEFNNLDFPTTINENTMLYSLFLQDPDLISKAESIVAEVDMPIESVSALTSGNHWYTKNSIALFLFPNNKNTERAFFRQDLIQTYQAENCTGEYSLTLNDDNTYSLIEKSLNDEKQKVINGKWLYRQHPYIELQKQGANFSEYYFEITRFRQRDQVSEIEFVKLAYLNSYLLGEGCFFLYGIRHNN